MLGFLKDPVRRGWAFSAIAFLLVVGLALPLVWDTDARHLTAYRAGDEDASLARDALDGRAGRVEAYLSTPHQLADIKEPQRTLLVILGSERRYSPGEAAAVVAFLERGGNVLLADEGGYGTDIAKEAGFGFVGTSLLDTRNHLGDPTLATSSARIEGRDFRLLFNAPTAIRPLRDAGAYEVLAESSTSALPQGSYLDTNENGEIDINDAASDTGSGFPLIVRTRVGDGTLVLVADTGLFMDAQVRLIDYDNGAFIGALAGTLVPRDGLIVLDEARHAPTPAVAPYTNAVRALGRATSGSVAPFITLALVLLASLAAWRATAETEDWSQHRHDLGVEVPVPSSVRPDLGRAQRMARHRVSERFNIPLEQVAAMTAEQLLALTGDRTLSEAAAGTLKSDPAPLFRSFLASEARSE